MTSLLIDDNSESLIMAGDWSTIVANYSVGGSMQHAGDNGASLVLAFSGTSISFFGAVNNTGSPPQLGSITIDTQTINSTGATSFQGNAPKSSPLATTRWYRSQTLSDGTHSIYFSDLRSVFLDYIVVEGESAPPLGGTVIVDDTDPNLRYSGDWRSYQGETIIVNQTLVVSPYSNSTHKTSTAGSSVTLQFSGISISVFGNSFPALNGTEQSTENLTVRYTLDGYATDLTYTSPLDPTMNLLLFANNSINVGQHTMVMQLMNATDFDLSLDYFLYTAPHISTTPGSSNANASSNTLKHTLIGALTGGVLGILTLIILVVYVRRRRRRKYNKSIHQGEDEFTALEPFDLPGTNENTQYLSRSAVVHEYHKSRLPEVQDPPVGEASSMQTNDSTRPNKWQNGAEIVPPAVPVGLIRANAYPPRVDNHEEAMPVNRPAASASGFIQPDIPHHNNAPSNSNVVSLPPPPPYEGNTLLKGDVVDERLRSFLDRVE